MSSSMTVMFKTQVCGLRRALGESCGDRSYIVTVPGRGNNFVAPVSVAGGAAPEGAGPKQGSIFEDILDNMTQRRDFGNVLSLPALMRVLEPCA
jgi:DNA-binding winged helix-turn-helix (wHTH) protein